MRAPGHVQPPAGPPPGAAQRQQTFKGQGIGEVVTFVARPHPLWYLVSSWRLLLLGLVLLGLFFVGDLLAVFGVPPLIFWAILLLLGGFHLTRWIAEDLNTWLFRKYILTDWRVIDDLGIFYRVRRQVGIDRIQEVRVARTSPLAMIFDIGDIVIRSAGLQGVLKLEGVHHPQQTARLIRIEQVNRGMKYAAKLVDIDAPALRPAWQHLDGRDDPAPPPPVPSRSAHRHLPIDFMPNEIVLECIRRHWFCYVYRARWAFAVLGGGMLLAFVGGGTGVAHWSALTWAICLGAIIIGGLWALTVYLNYADDFLVLTTHRVIGLNRLYFIFADTTNEVSYRKIQDVLVDISPLGQMLGFGTITIETAGLADNVTWDYLPDVNNLQDRIYTRIDAAEGRSERTKRRLRRLEFGRWSALLLNYVHPQVPAMRGVSLVAAARRAQAAGLRLIVEAERPVLNMPPGIVMEQMPSEGTTATRGGEVRVVLSGRP